MVKYARYSQFVGQGRRGRRKKILAQNRKKGKIHEIGLVGDECFTYKQCKCTKLVSYTYFSNFLSLFCFRSRLFLVLIQLSSSTFALLTEAQHEVPKHFRYTNITFSLVPAKFARYLFTFLLFLFLFSFILSLFISLLHNVTMC